METLRQLHEFFSLEISFLRTNIPKSKEEVVQKTNEIDDKVSEYKKILISLRDEISPQEYNKICNGLKEDLNALQAACKDFLSKLKESDPDPNPSDEEYEDINNLKFDKDSLKIVSAGKSKIRKLKIDYEFPMEAAFKCIPEFFGNSEELIPFIDQIKFFASYIPKGMDQSPLVNIIKLKLKGKSIPFINNLANLNWSQIEKLLIEEFSNKTKYADILKEIEILSQKKDESFKSYKDRTIQILNNLELLEFPVNNYVMESLIFHFIGGLKNQNIRDVADNNSDKSFRELLKLLEEKSEKKEKYEDLQKRLQSLALSDNSGSQQNNRWNQNRNFNFQNTQNRNNYIDNSNRTRNYQSNRFNNSTNPNLDGSSRTTNYAPRYNYPQNQQQNHHNFNQNYSNNSNRFNGPQNQYFNTNRGNNPEQNRYSDNPTTHYQQRKN